MFSLFERMVAFRYLRSRRREGFISVITTFSLLGIMLGVATLIIVMAVMNGFRQELIERVLGLSGHVSIYGAGQPLTDYERLADEVEAIAIVRDASPIVEGQALVSFRGNAMGAAVRGIRPADFFDRPSLNNEDLLLSSAEAFAGRDAVAIGEAMARRLGALPGDQITLIAPEGNVTALGTVPRMKAYTVVAIFSAGMHEYDSSFIYMPLEAAQIFYRVRDGVTALEIFLTRADALNDETRLAIAEVAGPMTRLWDWQQANSTFFNALKVERNVMFLILTLIILVAAFNIISGLVMLVKDKGRDIAILRTMGATRGAVMRIFFLTGSLIGVVGTLLGLGLGIAFADNIETIRQWLQATFDISLFPPEIYFLSQLPAEIQWSEVVLVAAMSLFLSFTATLYPSWRAARLDPVEALRYE